MRSEGVKGCYDISRNVHCRYFGSFACDNGIKSKPFVHKLCRGIALKMQEMSER